MKIVDPNYLGPKWLFDYRYNVLSDTGYLEGHKNVQELQKKLKGIVLRREKKSVMQDLPDLLETSRYVDILPQQKQVEAKNVEIAVNIMTQGRNRELSWNEKQIVQQCLVKARLACNAPELVNVQANSSPKLDELEELLEEIEPSPDKKIIIFSEWVRMLDLVKPRLEKRGLKYISFTGSVDSRYRQSYIDQFNNDPDKVIFLSSEAGGVGLNLQAASYVVNLDIPWNPGRLRQRINRIHRIGQKSNCTVINIVAKNCIEEGIELVLKSKMKVAEASLQEGSDSDFIELSSFLDYLDKYKENT